MLQLLSRFDCKTESLIWEETADVSNRSKACCSGSCASSPRDAYLSRQDEALESRLVWKDCVCEWFWEHVRDRDRTSLISPENEERTEFGILSEAGSDSRRNKKIGRWEVKDRLVVESRW